MGSIQILSILVSSRSDIYDLMKSYVSGNEAFVRTTMREIGEKLIEASMTE